MPTWHLHLMLTFLWKYFLTALYRAAACTVITIGKKKKSVNDWLDKECTHTKENSQKST